MKERRNPQAGRTVRTMMQCIYTCQHIKPKPGVIIFETSGTGPDEELLALMNEMFPEYNAIALRLDGLDHGDASDELNKVALVAWGPDFKSGKVETREIRSIDVTPTIVSMFGTRMGAKTGSVISGLFG